MSWLKSTEHKIKAGVFGLFRLMLRRGRKEVTLDPLRLKQVLFLRPEKIGDMVISMPTFEALRKAYPHIEISLLASPGNWPLVKDDSRFKNIYLYRKKLSDFLGLGEVRRQNFDCIFDMIDGDSVTTLFYSQLVARQAVRIGLGKEAHAPFYDINLSHTDGIGGHIIDNTLRLLEPLGVDLADNERFVPPYIPEAARKRIDVFLAAGDGAPKITIGLNLSAGKPNRIWPESEAVRFCQGLLDGPEQLRLIVMVTPGDRARGEQLMAAVGYSQMTLVPDKLSLLEISALISRLDLLVSPDTSLIHIARSFQVPVVGLYNRAGKNFRRWQPYRQVEGAVVGQHIDNLQDITAELVLDRTRQLLQAQDRVRS